MSTTTLQKRALHIPITTGPFSVCILHRDRWHVTSVDKPYEEVLAIAEDAYQRSGLAVQIRDENETILFEANADNEWEYSPTEAAKDTVSW